MSYRILRIVFIVLFALCAGWIVLQLIAHGRLIEGQQYTYADLSENLCHMLVYLTVAHMLRRWDERDDDKRVEAYEARVKEEREKERLEALEAEERAKK